MESGFIAAVKSGNAGSNPAASCGSGQGGDMAEAVRVPWEAKDLIKMAESRLEVRMSWRDYCPSKDYLYLDSMALSLLAIAKMMHDKEGA